MKNLIRFFAAFIAGFLLKWVLLPVHDAVPSVKTIQETIPPNMAASSEIAQLKKEKNELFNLYKKSLEANLISSNNEIINVANSVAIDSVVRDSVVYDSVNKVIKLADPSKSVFIPSLGLIFVDKNESIASGLKSTAGEVVAKLKFENTKSSPVLLFWIDYGGAPVFYKNIEPGETYEQSTFMTHPWVVTDLNGNRIGDIEAELPGKTEVIPINQ